MEKIREYLTKHELIVDSAEQVIERLSEHEAQKKYYSGKQKMYIFTNQFIVLPKGADIVDVVVGKPSPMSYIKICQQIFRKM
jgi:hypothetical protein